ncbi:putative transcriptional regulator [Frankia sp. EI5c]|uniref:helix-turn-helix domain-containing protein n=1 Tax=Frankia sp. EI5c TaxID=683316 RepID=UPI0007C353CC|nr:helix-turn-helix transcriptional regulator [Frankia sp. EI5c]OAA22262.1 putative transcriptional regulator [Frankia sp. EI5c]
MTDRLDGRSGSGIDAAQDDEDWPAVAAALKARMSAQRIGQQELADRAGISVSTLRLVQHGANRRVRNRTLTAIARALDWPDDHLVRVLTGNGEPGPTGAQAAPMAIGLEILAGVREIRDDIRRIVRRLDELDSAAGTAGTAGR